MDRSRAKDRLGRIDAPSLPSDAAGLFERGQEAARRPGVGLYEVPARLAKDREATGVSRGGVPAEGARGELSLARRRLAGEPLSSAWPLGGCRRQGSQTLADRRGQRLALQI